MLFGIGILSIALGVLVLILGVVIWVKQKYTFASRNKDVKKQDIQPFSKLIGQATLCFGAAITCEGVFFVLSLPLWGILGLTVLFVPGMILYSTAQSRYNKDGLN